MLFSTQPKYLHKIIQADKAIYKAFGFTISSDFDLPELPHIDIKENLVDITIKKAD